MEWRGIGIEERKEKAKGKETESKGSRKEEGKNRVVYSWIDAGFIAGLFGGGIAAAEAAAAAAGGDAGLFSSPKCTWNQNQTTLYWIGLDRIGFDWGVEKSVKSAF